MKEIIVNNYLEEIASLEELKAFLRVSGDYEDIVIKTLFSAVLKCAEGIMGIEISRKEVCINGLKASPITLKKPLIKVNSVKVGKNEVDFTLKDNILCFSDRGFGPVNIFYEVGFTKETMPSDVKVALIQHLISLYDVRINGGKIPSLATEIYNRYKNWNL